MSLLTYSEDRVLCYAYAYLDEFFETLGMRESLDDLEKILTHSLEPTVYRKETPALVLYHMNKLNGLIEASFDIFFSQKELQIAILDSKENGIPDLSDVSSFSKTQNPKAFWFDCPRNLTAAQFNNPYKALRKFCNYLPLTGWKKALREITEAALSNSSMQIDEWNTSYNLLIVRTRLFQLIEACHLLDVRSSKARLRDTA